MAHVFENFSKMCLEIYELDPAKYLSAPGLAWQLELLTDIDLLLMIEKAIGGEICQSIIRYTKVNSKYMKDYDKRMIKNYHI